MKIEYILTKKEDDFCDSVERFKNLLSTNSRITFENSKIKFSNVALDYSIKTEKIQNKKERIFQLVFISNNSDESRSVKHLEKIDKLFKRIIRESGIKFKLNTIWDEVSQYYCKSCYPRINEIENLMRKLIFRFMIKNIGSDWVKKSFPQKLRENIEKIAEKNEAKGLLENSLYEADFIQLIEFIFIPYPKNRDINKLFEMINAAEKLDDLEKAKEFQPKSNWERYFSSIIQIDDLEDKWRKLYKYRNKVAHNKPLTKDDNKNIVSISEEIKKALSKVLDGLDDIVVDNSDKEMISEVAKDSISIYPIYPAFVKAFINMQKLTINSDMLNNIGNLGKLAVDTGILKSFAGNIQKLSIDTSIIKNIKNTSKLAKSSEIFKNLERASNLSKKFEKLDNIYKENNSDESKKDNDQKN